MKTLKLIVDVKPNACWSCDEFYKNGICAKLEAHINDASHVLPDCPLVGVRDLKDPSFVKPFNDLVRLSGDIFKLQQGVETYANHIRATEGDWKDDEDKDYYRKITPLKKYDYQDISTELSRIANILEYIIGDIGRRSNRWEDYC